MNREEISVEKYFPSIQTPDGLAYGGCQEWYPVEMKRWAGCASVAGANLASFYDCKDRGLSSVYEQDLYIKRMDEMYLYMTPGHRGFPNPYVFRDRFVQYQKDHGYDFTGEIRESWQSADEAFEFICESLNNQQLVVILILKHEAESIQENTWHWMCIPEVNVAKRTFAVSTYGVKEEYSVDEIFASKEGNQVWLIRFNQV